MLRKQQTSSNEKQNVFHCCDVSEVLVKKKLKQLSRGEQADKAKREGRPVVLPYVHKVSHNLKKVTNRFRIPVVFSVPNKLSVLC